MEEKTAESLEATVKPVTKKSGKLPLVKRTRRITQEDREEMIRRVFAGENATKVGVHFGVSRAYVSLLKQTRKDPERFRKKREAKLGRKLTNAELETFREALATRKPGDYELVDGGRGWNLKLGKQLASKLFNKVVSQRLLVECIPHPTLAEPWRYQRPKPPGPRDINNMSPESASDPEYVAWYLSAKAAELEQRCYEAALKDYDERFDEAGNLKPQHQRKRGRPPGKQKPPVLETTPEPEQNEQEVLLKNISEEEVAALLAEWEERAQAGDWPVAALDRALGPATETALGQEQPPAPGQRSGKHAKQQGTNFLAPKQRKKRR